MKTLPLAAAVIFVLASGGSTMTWAASAHHAKASQHSKPLRSSRLCSSSKTDDILACSVEGEKAAERHLEKAWRDVTRYIYDEDGSNEHCAMLKASQRAWLAYRDAECSFYSAGTGQMTEPNAANCRAALAEARARELETYPPNATRDAFEALPNPTCKP